MHGEHDGANPEAVAMGDGSGRRDLAGSDRGAVLAPEILDRRGRASHRDRRVTARHALGLEAHRRLRRSADDVLALAEGRLPAAPREANRDWVAYPKRCTVRMNRGEDGVSPSARRISAMRFERFFSTTNVSGHRRSCSARLETA
jgi:hypothetical protein